MNLMQMLGAAAVAGGRHALAGKHRHAPKPSRSRYRRQKAARRADREAKERWFVRSQERMDELRGQVNVGQLQPVHPRDHYWYGVGLLGGAFGLQPPTHGGGSYYARYRAMYEAGARRKAVAGS